MLLDYYVGAFTRSGSAAWLWATGQGILLTWLLPVGLSIASIAIAVGRAAIKYHSWQEAKNHVGNTLADFVG